MMMSKGELLSALASSTPPCTLPLAQPPAIRHSPANNAWRRMKKLTISPRDGLNS